MTVSETAPEVTRLTLEERAEMLQAAVQHFAKWHWRVASQTQAQAQLVKGKPTNHILHLILSIITLGVWLIVWALVAIGAGEKHMLVTVDEWGNVTTTTD